MDLQETIAIIEALLGNETAFEQLVECVFDSIDTDKSGSIEIEEIETFIKDVCKEGLGEAPDKESIKAVFDLLDEDHSNSIEKSELGAYLRMLFEDQKQKAETIMETKNKKGVHIIQ